MNAPASSLLLNQDRLRVLAVEDDIVSLGFLRAQLHALDHEMIPARNGIECLKVLSRKDHGIDVVLMDREMPELDGLSTIRRMKDDEALREIPVIMITGAGTKEDMQEGIEAGVFYYLTKPVEPDILRSVLDAAGREARQSAALALEMGHQRDAFTLIDTCRFQIGTLEEGERLTRFVSYCFPDPKRVLSGIGELIENAIEHGTLEIGYDEKTALVSAGTWRAEIERRQRIDRYKERRVTVTVSRRTDGVYLIVEDQGPGFDWKRFLEIDVARAGDNHGRGIAQANASSFDRLTYNESGNKAVAFVSNDLQLEW